MCAYQQVLGGEETGEGGGGEDGAPHHYMRSRKMAQQSGFVIGSCAADGDAEDAARALICLGEGQVAVQLPQRSLQLHAHHEGPSFHPVEEPVRVGGV